MLHALYYVIYVSVVVIIMCPKCDPSGLLSNIIPLFLILKETAKLYFYLIQNIILLVLLLFNISMVRNKGH